MSKFKIGQHVRVLEGNGWVKPGVYPIIEIDDTGTHRIAKPKGTRLWINICYLKSLDNVIGGELI